MKPMLGPGFRGGKPKGWARFGTLNAGEQLYAGAAKGRPRLRTPLNFDAIA